MLEKRKKVRILPYYFEVMLLNANFLMEKQRLNGLDAEFKLLLELLYRLIALICNLSCRIVLLFNLNKLLFVLVLFKLNSKSTL
jgi:hypothetical protein